MIHSRKDYRFGGRITIVEHDGFHCMISTAKDGVFKKQSTYLLDVTPGIPNGERFAHIAYRDTLSSEQRLECHDFAADFINQVMEDTAIPSDALKMRAAADTLFIILAERDLAVGKFLEGFF